MVNVDEAAARIFRGHALLIAVCLVLPVLFVLWGTDAQPLTYQSTSRVQLGPELAFSNVNADAASTKALALVTSPKLVRKAIADTGVDRSAATVAKDHVTVRRVGLSPVVEVSVTDADPTVAEALDASLTEQLVAFLNRAGRETLTQRIEDLDEQLAALEKKRAKLAATVLAGTGAQDPAAALDRLTPLDSSIEQLRTERAALALADAQRPRAVVVNQAEAAEPQPQGRIQSLVLALFVGLVLGIGAAAVVETARPTIPTPRALARLLEVPLLGWVPAKNDGRAFEAVERVSLAARRHDVTSVVLLTESDADERLASELTGILRAQRLPATNKDRPEPQVSAVAVQPRKLAAASNPSAPRRSQPDLLPGSTVREGAAPQIAPIPGARNHYSVNGSLAMTLSGDERPGAVLVASLPMRARRLDDMHDLLTAAGWPLLGVLVVDRPSRRRIRVQELPLEERR